MSFFIFKVEGGELDFDYCLSSLDFLPNLSHMPRILKDKMPNTRRGKMHVCHIVSVKKVL